MIPIPPLESLLLMVKSDVCLIIIPLLPCNLIIPIISPGISSYWVDGSWIPLSSHWTMVKSRLFRGVWKDRPRPLLHHRRTVEKVLWVECKPFLLCCFSCYIFIIFIHILISKSCKLKHIKLDWHHEARSFCCQNHMVFSLHVEPQLISHGAKNIFGVADALVKKQ